MFLARILAFSCLSILTGWGFSAAAQDEGLPEPTLFVDGEFQDGVQIAHALSIRLKTNYCYHQFVMAYGGDEPLMNLNLTVHFGFRGKRIHEADLIFGQLGGTFVDDKHLTFGINAACEVDEFRIISFEADLGEERLDLTGGLTLTTAYLTKLSVTQGLPIPETTENQNFAGANLGDEGTIKCISNGVNLRGGPSTSHVILAVLEASADNRQEILILRSLENGDWFEVQTTQGRGYLYHTLLGPCP